MINKKKNALVVIVFSIILTGLFHKQAIGLNLLIVEGIFFLWILSSKQFQFKGFYHITLGLGLVLTLISTIVTHSVFSYVMHFIVFFAFVGLLIYPETKSLLNTIGQAFGNTYNSQIQFFKQLFGFRLKGHDIGSYIWKFRVFIIPIFIIFIFIGIYRKSNPYFEKLVDNIGFFIQEKLIYIFSGFDLMILITFLISVFISIFIFIRTSNQRLIEIDANASEDLVRKRRKKRNNFRINALRYEYKAGVFLLIVLNLLILVLNIVDIKWVWFGFEWEGQYLKQFVHEGTYLLILSILISIVLVLYFFRNNLNFFPNNTLLKYLSYIWLVQNGVLTVSVAIRNFLYINYFALAYKRIGVIIFLILTIYGLYSVYIKVYRRKSTFFLFNKNTIALLILLIVSSMINWDTVIAKYNFRNSNKSFLHLDFLSTLSDKSLPYLDKPLPELMKIDSIQKEKFPFDEKYMTPEEYVEIISYRKINFIEKWESKSILSWNLPEYIAFKKFKKESRTNP